MKRLIIVLASLAFAAAAAGQDMLSSISSALSSSRVDFDYSYTVKSSVDIKGSGHVSLQGDAFRMTGDGLEVVCDGKVRWTVDKAAKECYIEAVDGGAADYEANPALMIASLDKAFNLKGSRSASFRGRSVTALDMTPKDAGSAFTAVTLYLSGTTPAGAEITVQDGTKTEFVISGYKMAAPVDTKPAYTFDTGSLDSGYMVTDLR